MVIVGGLRWLALGLAIGVPASIVLVRIFQNRIWALKSSDALTLAAVVVLLTAVGLAACYYRRGGRRRSIRGGRCGTSNAGANGHCLSRCSDHRLDTTGVGFKRRYTTRRAKQIVLCYSYFGTSLTGSLLWP